MSNQTTNEQYKSDKTMTWLAYGLYGLGLIFAGIPTLVGLILSYVKRGNTESEVLKSHFTNLIRLFWISVVLVVIVMLLGGSSFAEMAYTGSLPFTGILSVLLSIAAGIWYLYRLVLGVVRLSSDKAI